MSGKDRVLKKESTWRGEDPGLLEEQQEATGLEGSEHGESTKPSVAISWGRILVDLDLDS